MRVWPLLLPVPLALLFYAAALRVGDYGVTPDRYLLILFGLVTLGTVACQLKPRWRGDIRILAGLPVVALLLASFGPQGAVLTSVRSQTGRFLALVEGRPLEGALHEQALSALRFLSEHDALAAVAPADLAPADVNGEPDLFRRTALAYSLDPDLALAADGTGSFSMSYGQTKAVPVGEFDLVAPNLALYVGGETGNVTTLPSGKSLEIRLREGAFDIVAGAETASFAIDPALLSTLISTQGTDAPAIRLSAGSRAILVVPTYFYGDTGETPFIRNIGGTLFLRAADWR